MTLKKVYQREYGMADYEKLSKPVKDLISRIDRDTRNEKPLSRKDFEKVIHGS